MTLEEFITKNNLGFRRLDTDELIINNYLDFEMKLNTTYDEEVDFSTSINSFRKLITLESL